MSNEQIDGHMTVSLDATVGGNLVVRGDSSIGHDLSVEGWLRAPNIIGYCRGLFRSLGELETAIPRPQNGWTGLVGDHTEATVYYAVNGKWVGGNKGVVTFNTASKVLADDMEAAKKDVAGAKDTAASAMASALSAVTKSEEAKGVAQQAMDVAGTAERKASGAVSKAEDALAASSEANANAREAVSKAEDAVSKADAAKRTASEAEDNAVNRIEAKVGAWGGICEIREEDGKVPESRVADEFREVLAYHGDKTPPTAFVIGSASCRAGNDLVGMVYRNPDTGCFWMESGGGCYPNWEGAEAWGTTDSNGRKPVGHKLYADLSQGKIYGYRQVGIKMERFEFSGIDPELTAKVDELEDYVGTIDRIQTALLDSKGEAGGLAPLNEQRKVSDEFIPARFASAVQFGGVFGEGVPGSLHYAIQPTSVPVSSAEYPVRYFAKDNLFAIEVDGKYYCNWENAAEFGEVRAGEGVTPVRDKLYYDINGVYAHISGSGLVKIADLGGASGSGCDCGTRLDELEGRIDYNKSYSDATDLGLRTDVDELRQDLDTYVRRNNESVEDTRYQVREVSGRLDATNTALVKLKETHQILEDTLSNVSFPYIQGLIGGVEGKADANAAAIETLRSGLENIDGGKVDEVLELISGSGVMPGQEARQMVVDIWGGETLTPPDPEEPVGEDLTHEEARDMVSDIFG